MAGKENENQEKKHASDVASEAKPVPGQGDVEVEQAAETLRKARDAKTEEAGEGENSLGYENLHYGEQSDDTVDPAGEVQDATVNNTAALDDSDTVILSDSEEKALNNDNPVETQPEFSGLNPLDYSDAPEFSPQATTAESENVLEAGAPLSFQNIVAEEASSFAQEARGTRDDETADVNGAPTDISLSNTSVAENSEGAVVASLTASDVDASDTATFSIAEDNSGAFEIVSDQLKLKDGVSLNHEGQDSYEVTIEVTDSEGASYTETVTIDVADVNEGPTDISLSNTSVAENSEGAVVASLTASDIDAGDTETFSIADDSSGVFEIVGDQLKLKDGISLDHEGQDSYEVTIEVSDSEGASYTETVTIDVADVNEGPTDISLSNASVDENDAGAVVASLTASDVDAGDTETFSIADDSSGVFEIVGDQLKLKDGISLDHEGQDSYEVTIEVTDSEGASYTETVTIDVADVNEGPTDIQLSGTSVDENSEGAVVASLTASDVDDGDTASFAITDDASGVFEIVGDQLKLKDGVSLNHEGQDSYEVTIEVSDSEGASYTETVTIDVADVNEGPTDIQLSGTSVGENVSGAMVATLTALDSDAGDTATFSIAEDSSGAFEILGDQLKLKDGISLDHEGQDAYEVTIEVTDSNGASYTETVTIDVADVNEGPTDLQLSNTSVAENREGAVVASLTASDVDVGDTASFAIVEDASGAFEIVGDQLKLKDGVSLDHEGQAAHEVTIEVTDSEGASYTETVIIDVADVNEGPTDIQLSGTSVDENSEGAVVASLTASDVDDGDTASFAITDDASGVFEIVGDQLKLKDGISLDHEGQDSYEVTIEVTDSEGASYTETVTIDVADVNEGPTDIQLSGTSVGENVSGAMVATLTALDSDAGDTATFSIAEDASGAFEIVGDQLKLKDSVSLDHEGQDSYEVTIEVTDSEGASYTETVTIDVADVNEGPTDLALSNTSVAENSEGAVVASLTATDVDDGDTAIFSIAEDASGAFEIVGDQLKLKDGVSLNHEGQDSYEVTIEVADSEGASYTETVTIDVADVNEGPTDIQFTSANDPVFLETDGLLVIEAENFQTNTAGDGHEWGESRLDGAVHVSNNGAQNNIWRTEEDTEQNAPELTYAVHFETPGVYYVHVRGFAEDGRRGNSDSVHIGLNGERQSDDGGITGFNSNSLAWGNRSTFTREVVEIQIDEPGTYDINLWAREDGVTVDKFILTQDENYQPSGEGPPESPRTSDFTVFENDNENSVVATLNTLDPDSGDTHEYTLVDEDGNAVIGGDFEIVGNEIRVSEDADLDFESEPIQTLHVKTTDSAGNSYVESVDVNIADVDEGPNAVDIELGSISEDQTLTISEADFLASSFDPEGAVLSITNVSVDPAFGVLEDNGDGTWTFSPVEDFSADDIQINFTVSDGELSDTGALSFDIEAQADTPLLTIGELPPAVLNEENISTTGFEGGTFGNFSSGSEFIGSFGDWKTTSDAIEVKQETLADGSTNQYIELNDDAIDRFDDAISIHKTIDTEEGASYTIDFEYAGRPGFNEEVNEINVVVNGEVVGQFSADGTGSSVADWQNGSVTFEGDGGPMVVEFISTGQALAFGRGMYLDDISITESLPEGVVTASENEIIALPDISFASTDSDGSEVVSLSINDIPEGFILSDGENSFTADGENSGIDVSDWQLDQLTVTPVDEYSGQTSLTVTATSIDGDSTAETTQTIDLTIANDDEIIQGTDKTDVLHGGAGDDTLIGGDGSDTFIYDLGDGSDIISGGGWTDTIEFVDGLQSLGEFGVDWTIELTEGSIVSQNNDAIELTDGADGLVTLSDGAELSFTDIEQFI